MSLSTLSLSQSHIRLIIVPNLQNLFLILSTVTWKVQMTRRGVGVVGSCARFEACFCQRRLPLNLRLPQQRLPALSPPL